MSQVWEGMFAHIILFASMLGVLGYTTWLERQAKERAASVTSYYCNSRTVSILQTVEDEHPYFAANDVSDDVGTVGTQGSMDEDGLISSSIWAVDQNAPCDNQDIKEAIKEPNEVACNCKVSTPSIHLSY